MLCCILVHFLYFLKHFNSRVCLSVVLLLSLLLLLLNYYYCAFILIIVIVVYIEISLQLLCFLFARVLNEDNKEIELCSSVECKVGRTSPLIATNFCPFLHVSCLFAFFLSFLTINKKFVINNQLAV